MQLSDVIKLKNVRLSFLRLDTPKAFQAGQDERYEATALLDPSNAEHAALITTIKATAKKAAEDKWGAGNVPKGLKLCYFDGSTKDYDGYEGMFAVATNRKKKDGPPAVVNRRGEVVSAGQPEYPFSGAYGNVSIKLFAYDNVSKGISAELRGVQFARPGTAFGQQPVNAEEEFEALEDNSELESSAATDDFEF